MQFLLYQDRNIVNIGPDCMISNTVVFRAAENPHLIFNADTAEYLDWSDGMEIGEHVWIGEGDYITKRAVIARGSIVAARAVVSRRFDEEQVVIAGNPVAIARRRIAWVRNRGHLKRGSAFERSYREAKSSLLRDPD